MKYKKGHFYIEDVGAERIAKKFGTPSYVYSYDKIKNNINNFKKNFKTINPLICFSVKSNSNLKILNLINKFGLGADVVSKGELVRALKAKIRPEKTIFSGFILAFKALMSSPFETTSVPNPNLLIKLKIFKLELDFTEKQIKGFIVLKFFLKLLILFFILSYE